MGEIEIPRAVLTTTYHHHHHCKDDENDNDNNNEALQHTTTTTTTTTNAAAVANHCSMTTSSPTPLPPVATAVPIIASGTTGSPSRYQELSQAALPQPHQQHQGGAPTTQQQQHHQHHRYAGGFSTSICDLFAQHATDRSSCCALVCCGWLLETRNRHALECHDAAAQAPSTEAGTTSTTTTAATAAIPMVMRPRRRWWEQVAMWVVVVVLLITLLPATWIPAVFWAAVAVIAIHRTLAGAQLRQSIAARLPSNQHRIHSLVGAEYALCCSEFRNAHRCITCVRVDRRRDDDDEYYESNNNINEDGSRSRDFCYYLWNCAAKVCCGWAGCWFNLCGMCATGQEHRELRKLLPPERFWYDYLTFQPYHEYLTRIEMLRRSARTHSLWEHMSTLSHLSAQLIHFLWITLALLTLLTVFHSFRNFHLDNLIVVFLTLGQAFAVMYGVHWWKHRLDLSLDAVIKLFASGFCLATFIAMLVELLISQVSNFIFSVAILTEYMEDNPDADFTNADDDDDGTGTNGPTPYELIHDIYQHHLATLIIYVLFDAFIVAGLVEELSKYFCFWMVEHPDFMPAETVAAVLQQGRNHHPPNNNHNHTAADGNSGINNINSGISNEDGFDGSTTTSPSMPMPQRRTVSSHAAATTVGMVATAAGFACAENIGYTLGVGQSFKSEFLVLLMRSLLPVHPLCAAIQSIGIVRRDIEGVGALGQAIFPAVLLHGAFDFAVMLLGIIVAVKQPPPTEDDSNNNTNDDDTADDEAAAALDVTTVVFSMVIGFAIMFVGLAYYILQARRQRHRLQVLEASAAANVSEVNNPTTENNTLL